MKRLVMELGGHAPLIIFDDADINKAVAITMPQGDIIGFAPPLCLTREEAGIVVSATVKAIKIIL